MNSWTILGNKDTKPRGTGQARSLAVCRPVCHVLRDKRAGRGLFLPAFIVLVFWGATNKVRLEFRARQLSLGSCARPGPCRGRAQKPGAAIVLLRPGLRRTRRAPRIAFSWLRGGMAAAFTDAVFPAWLST